MIKNGIAAFFRRTLSCVVLFAALFPLARISESAVLNLTTNDNEAVVTGGGVYQSVNVTGSNSPAITILNRDLTLTGTGTGQAMLTGASSAVLEVNNVRLSLGAATTPPGGVLPGDVSLSHNAQLRVYGNGLSQYVLEAAGTAKGAVYGQGSLLLRYDANFQAGVIGAQNTPLTGVTLETGCSLAAINGIYTSAMNLASAKASVSTGSAQVAALTITGSGSSLTAARGDINIGSAAITGEAALEAATGSLSVSDGLNLSSGHTTFTAGRNISLTGTAGQKAGAGTFSAQAGEDVTITSLNADFTAISAAGDAKLTAADLAGQTFTAKNVTLDSSQDPTHLAADSFSAASISSTGSRTALLEADSLKVSGAINGGAGLRIITKGDLTATSAAAGSIEAASLNVTSGTLTLYSNQASEIKGDAHITGHGESGVFKNLNIGGALTVSGANETGGWLKADSVTVGGAASSSLAVTSLQTTTLTAAGSAPAKAAAGAFTAGMNVAAGENGQVSLGQTSTTWLDRVLSGHHATDATALGVYNPAELSGVVLSPASAYPVAQAGAFDFESGSVLVVNAEKAKESVNSNGMLTAAAPASARVANGAKLILDGVAANSVYGVLGRNIAVSYAGDSAWEGGNLETTSHLIAARKIPGRDGWFRTTQLPASDVYPELDPGIMPPLDSGVDAGDLGTEADHFNSSHAGVRFLSRTGSTTYMDHDYRSAVKTLESAVRIAALGAVPQMAYSANNASMEASENRAFAIPHENIDEDAKRSFALWLMPLYHALNHREWPANNFNYDTWGGLGGLTLGADWTHAEMFRLGIAASMGGGYAKSGGDLAKTVNNMGFAGIGLYAGASFGNLGLAADINYTGTWNSLKQQLPANLEMDDLTGEFTAHALSASLMGRYAILLTENLRLIPYAGVRHTWLVTDNYTVYSDGALLDGEKSCQSIWTFPAGLELAGLFRTESGWTFKPGVKAGVMPAAGDLATPARVRFTGVPGEGSVTSQMMDYTLFTGGLGIEAARENFSLALRSDVKLGMHGEETSLYGVLRWEF